MPTSLRLGAYASRYRFALLLLFVMLACFLAGCASEGRDAHAGANRLSPVSGGTLRLIQQAPATLDPVEGSSVYESLPVNQIFDGLVELDAGMRVVPGLAETWTISRDGLTYEFRLRPDLSFHDGTEVTSEDVVHVFKRILAPEADGKDQVLAFLEELVGAKEFASGDSDDLPGIEAVGPSVVRIRLHRPKASLLEILTGDEFKVVPKSVMERIGKKAFGRAPVGTGPFKLERWGDDGLSLVSNADYHGNPPYLDRIEISFLSDDETDSGTVRFLRGEVDLVEPTPSYIAELSEKPDIRTRRYPELSLTFLGFGIRNFPVNRVEVRQAIAHALNREVLLSDLPMFRREAVGLMPPGLAGYSPSQKVLPYDPERARELLANAGYTTDNPLPPVPLYTASMSDAALKTLKRIRNDLNQVGIHLDVREVSWGELDSRIIKGEAPAFLLAMIAGLTDPDSYLRGFFDYDEAWQLFGFRDEACERLLEKGTLEADPLERARTYRELERMILERAPLVPLYHTVGILSSWKSVHGLEMGPAGLAKVRFEKVWIEEGGRNL